MLYNKNKFKFKTILKNEYKIILNQIKYNS